MTVRDRGTEETREPRETKEITERADPTEIRENQEISEADLLEADSEAALEEVSEEALEVAGVLAQPPLVLLRLEVEMGLQPRLRLRPRLLRQQVAFWLDCHH